MSVTGFGYKAHIDGLRAVAVLLVVLYHIGIPGIHGGFIGVDVFFVISGYLITSLLLAESVQHGRIDLAGFYARRVRRLFPAMMIVVLATIGLGAVFLLPIFSEQSALAKSAIATSFYVSNFYFWRYTGDYFGSPTDFEPLLHTWSLAVEEQFYLVWPLLIIVLLKVRNGRRDTLARDLLLLLATLSVVSFSFSLWATRTQPTAAFYLMPSRAWQFGVGGILAIALSQGAKAGHVIANLLSATGLVAVIGAGLFLTERGFPGANALLPTLGTAAVIAGNTLNSGTCVAALLSWQPMRFVGLVSYSWYLWHWPLLAIARASALERQDLTRDLSLGLLSLLLAILTYRFIENPIRQERPGPFKATVPTLWAGAIMSVFLAVTAIALALNAKRVANSNPRYAAAEHAREDVPILRSACNIPMLSQFPGLPDVQRCTYGNAAEIRAVLWGDSHADHLSGLMQAFSAEHGDRGILQRTGSSCRTYGDDPVKTTAGMVKACEDFNIAVEKEIADLQQRGLTGVIISTMWVSVFRDPDAFVAPNINTSPEYYAQAEAAFDMVVTRLEGAGLRVLIVGPFHLMPSEVPQCIARHTDEDCAASRSIIERQRRVSLEMLRSVKSRHGDLVRLWDPIDSLCDSRICPAANGGAVLYTDALHLTVAGGAALLPAARSELAWVTGS
jgi:peptidoglycan/LPS O-acetylase OafA/YrhL